MQALAHSTRAHIVRTSTNDRIFQKRASSRPRSSAALSQHGPSSSLSLFLQSFEQSALHQSAVCPHGGRTSPLAADNKRTNANERAAKADCEVQTLVKEKRP